MKKAKRLIAPALGVGLVFGAIGVSASETVTVESGDTYWDIAQGYEDVSSEDLIEANPYAATAIPIGADITVPSADVVTHVVQPGNTLIEIAAVYDGVTVDDLFRLNPGIDPYDLRVGSEVVVVELADTEEVVVEVDATDTEEAVAEGDTTADDRELGEEYESHAVQPGKSFYSIR